MGSSTLNAETVKAMRDVDIRTVDPETLRDIQDVQIRTELPKKERMLDFIRQIGNPYVVKVSFTDTDVTLEERMLPYIRSKN